MKLTLPLKSTHARGTLASTLTFKQKRRTSCVQRRTKPSQPRTPKQKGQRIMFTLLGSEWAGLTEAQRASWSQQSGIPQPDNFHRYMSYNLLLWRAFHAPTKSWPADQLLQPANAWLDSCLPGKGSITVVFKVSAFNENWAHAFFRNPTKPFYPSPANCAGFDLQAGGGTLQWLDTDVPPGTYWYAMASFSIDGKWHFASAYRQGEST